ncbi:MAG: DUF2139 domain-containing protein [Thermosphaera aggregans]|uniref:DUF2139 domain-containing protein n=1 Tax=Thermosphaera aggregans TaxID=54254 RepID=UPI003C04ED1F
MKYLFKPTNGPEWGSGGIFGLTYYRGVVYYTLAMEGEAHFHHEDSENIYRFELLGNGPASGGDTYNAVDYVDDKIYFGGWVHKPAIYKGRVNGGGEIDFRNKYSHIHEYDIAERRVRLVWSDSIHHEYEWVGEVSQIVYDPLSDSLLVARADGMRDLGVYKIDRNTGRAEQVSSVPALKGALYQEYACFDLQPDWKRGVDGVQCFDLVEKKLVKNYIEDWSKISIDGYPVERRGSGYAATGYTRYWHFFRGGLIVGNPVEPVIEELTFVRMFDFPGTPYAPHRSNALPIGGGILAVFNSYSHGYIHVAPEGRARARLFNTVVGPTTLVYVIPPVARIVATLGARVTSMTKKDGSILIGVSNTPNLGGKDATPLENGWREIIEWREDALLNAPLPPVVFRVLGSAVLDQPFGGIPLTGYRVKALRVFSSKSNALRIAEYDIGLPPARIEDDKVTLKEGWNRIDLSDYSNIVSFKLDTPDEKALIYINLE